MKKNIDLLIINNVPSFYKINLYNELAKKCKIHVIFLALTNQVVINDNFEKEISFSFDLISNIQIEKRNKFESLKKVFSICDTYNYKKIIYGGYVDFEVNFLLFMNKKSKNCLQFESSIKESKITGFVALIKKILLSRISIALPSGKLQTDVFKSLRFRGKIIETKGVGIFNKKKNNKSYVENSKLKYLYVGRLISLKNLEFLIETFNQLDNKLTIVGSGVLEKKLKQIANSNISFTGFISNEDIHEQYFNHDVFILPSLSEPWGLVVEEAIFCGLPVIVSDAVGCQEEMVIKPKTGVVFSLNDKNSLLDAINNIEINYDYYRLNSLSFDFYDRDLQQINQYLEILKI